MTDSPRFAHNQPERTGVLLINLGTPDAPTAPALRRYLKEFLSDRRVVEIPRLVWWPILNGIILNTRPKKSAAKYASIWTADGSPLRVFTERLTKLLRGRLGEDGLDLEIASAMRYGQPSIPRVLDQLRDQGCTRILVVPLYPQYAGSTSATALDVVATHLQGCRNQYALRTIRSFPDDPGYIEALAAQVRRHWVAHGPLGEHDKLLMSFHGVPRRTLDLGDPYHCECHKTGRLLAEALGLAPERWQLTFQSRFGRAQWLQPYTAPTLEALGRAGTARVDVVCPGFVADCLETLEEIALEGKASFLGAGGKTFHYIPCLNDDPAWVAAVADLVRAQLSGWPAAPLPDAAALAERLARARALGAPG